MTTDIPNSRAAKLLYGITLFVILLGEVGALVFLIRASENPPVFLFVLFILWVSSPFAGLLLAFRFARHWQTPIRVMLYCLALVVTAGSLLIYSQIIRPPAGSAHAFVWLVTPGAAWLLTISAVSIAALRSRR